MKSMDREESQSRMFNETVSSNSLQLKKRKILIKKSQKSYNNKMQQDDKIFYEDMSASQMENQDYNGQTFEKEKEKEETEHEEEEVIKQQSEFTQKRKRGRPRKVVVIQKKEEDNEDEDDDFDQLIDCQNFNENIKKGFSKYGNKRGRRKANEKDHNIPLSDKSLMEKLNEILIQYGFHNQDRAIIKKMEDAISSNNLMVGQIKDMKSEDQEKKEQSSEFVQSKEFLDSQMDENHSQISKNEDGYKPIVNESPFEKNSASLNIMKIEEISTASRADNSQDMLFLDQTIDEQSAIKKQEYLSYNLPEQKVEDDNISIIKKEECSSPQQKREDISSIKMKLELNSTNSQFIEDSMKMEPLENTRFMSNSNRIEDEENEESEVQMEFKSENISRLIKLEQESRDRLNEKKEYEEEDERNDRQSRSYKLSEDLKIIVIMSEKKNVINGYSSNYWKQVVNLGLIHRPHESLRDRYKRFIKYLTRDNLLTIIRWIEKRHSIDGYLNFVKYLNNFKVFSHVSQEDPFASKKYTFSGKKRQSRRQDEYQGSSSSDSASEKEEQECKNEDEMRRNPQSIIKGEEIKQESQRKKMRRNHLEESMIKGEEIKQESQKKQMRRNPLEESMIKGEEIKQESKIKEMSFLLNVTGEVIQIDSSDLSDADQLERDEIFLKYKRQCSLAFAKDIKQQKKIQKLYESISIDYTRDNRNKEDFSDAIVKCESFISSPKQQSYEIHSEFGYDPTQQQSERNMDLLNQRIQTIYPDQLQFIDQTIPDVKQEDSTMKIEEKQEEQHEIVSQIQLDMQEELINQTEKERNNCSQQVLLDNLMNLPSNSHSSIPKQEFNTTIDNLEQIEEETIRDQQNSIQSSIHKTEQSDEGQLNTNISEKIL